MRKGILRWAGLAFFAASAGVLAQAGPAPTPPPAEAAPEAIPFRPIEGSTIINLPSVDVPSKGTLTTWFTHRFRSPVQGSNIHDLFSLDQGADIGIGLGYAPIANLDFSVYRSSSDGLDPWEIAAKYRVVSACGFGLSLRLGGDIRSESGRTNRGSFFAQMILSYSLGDRIRITAVPTYVNKIAGKPDFYDPNGDPPSFPPPNDSSCVGETSFGCFGLYRNVFNVPAALSVAVTHSITLHAEVTPRYGKADSIGVGWIVSIEKTLLRHRFSFAAGNQRQTTVDQYVASPPYWTRYRPPASNGKVLGAEGIYFGFNILRQWKLN
jgi:Membrane bound beta barrel domain (DUF5777)